jgi:NAD(P)H-hydrate repair Nnr-like enzyme with NAD(P)H-hydrate dehydratase domain
LAAPDAAALAVWLHGRAGDLLTASCTAEAYSSMDLIGALPDCFLELYR